MERLSINEQETIVLDLLNPYFQDFGFKRQLHQGMSSCFIAKTDFGVAFVMFHFISAGQTCFSLGLSYADIEKFMVSIGNPQVDFSNRILNDDYSGCTVYDSQQTVSYEHSKQSTSTTKGAERFAQIVIDYMETRGWAFLERYSRLPNILNELNTLHATGQYWRKLLGGQADHFLRGLRIANLCNDPQILAKVTYVDNIFYDPQYNLHNWLPYYEKFKKENNFI
ncbi:hypothetical protein CLV58_13036 [Spirosoma oryzae]|uniref:DUF4304 domain-containing protein n=1 Tax=Spirosoma oryzae TaxID=1469603 RepID=A0A2T0S437_9BACT|nr:hypothetical protein [Spirosoma oryzae]PRY28179.1 hypothetical protein CLV58_13036 [Spirosoma oryzae]